MKKLLVALILLFAAPALAEMKYFAVTAYNDFGESGYSDEVNCDLGADWQQVVLQWNGVPEATGYKVYYGGATRDYKTPKDVGNSTTHTFIRLGSPTVTVVCE